MLHFSLFLMDTIESAIFFIYFGLVALEKSSFTRIVFDRVCSWTVVGNASYRLRPLAPAYEINTGVHRTKKQPLHFTTGNTEEYFIMVNEKFKTSADVFIRWLSRNIKCDTSAIPRRRWKQYNFTHNLTPTGRQLSRGLFLGFNIQVHKIMYVKLSIYSRYINMAPNKWFMACQNVKGVPNGLPKCQRCP